MEDPSGINSWTTTVDTPTVRPIPTIEPTSLMTTAKFVSMLVKLAWAEKRIEGADHGSFGLVEDTGMYVDPVPPVPPGQLTGIFPSLHIVYSLGVGTPRSEDVKSATHSPVGALMTVGSCENAGHTFPLFLKGGSQARRLLDDVERRRPGHRVQKCARRCCFAT